MNPVCLGNILCNAGAAGAVFAYISGSPHAAGAHDRRVRHRRRRVRAIARRRFVQRPGLFDGHSALSMAAVMVSFCIFAIVSYAFIARPAEARGLAIRPQHGAG
jgi:hypothetical protein